MIKVKWASKDKDEIEVHYKDLIYGKSYQYFIKSDGPECWPVEYKTATTDMKDWIGNIVTINDKICSVKGVYRGRMITHPKVKIMGTFKPGQRVMVTEHVSISGVFEMIATQKRILKGDDNFINIGFSNEKRARVLRIDLYTGEFREMVVGSVKR